MDINLIGVPLTYGCDRDGAQLGPKKLRENGILDIIKNHNHSVYDMGDIFIPFIAEEDKYKDHPKMKFLNTIANVNTNLANNVYSSLKTNRFPFVIGGDHSVAMGSIAGASKFFKKMAVIWIDAHGDINTDNSSPSGNVHGMPLSASMNECHNTLGNIYFDGQKINAENVYILGARDIDPGEFELAEKLQVSLYTMDIIKERGLDTVIQEVISSIKSSDIDGVHLSFDIDALDSSLVPGTGTPVIDGFTMNEGKSLFSAFLGANFITSMDFVELNPKLDNENEITIKNCLDILDHIFKNL